MTAEIVSVGTELLLGQIVDTHAPVMARILAECGIGCVRRSTIGDNRDRLVSELKDALERADVLVTIGGLGPTVDDLTRDAIAEAVGDELVVDDEILANLKSFFASRGVDWLESNGRQAQVPTSGTTINNPNGTAPGLHVSKNGKTILALPGPKGEFNPMADGPVREILQSLQGDGMVIHSRTLRIVGEGESAVEARVRDLMDSGNPTVAPYAHLGEVHLRLTARAKGVEAAEAIIDPVEAEIRSRLGQNVFGADGITLEASLLDQLDERNGTLAVAESMTGGELAARLTSVPGSSRVFLGGVVTYTPRTKQSLLGIPGEIAADPVSDEVARAMAMGVRMRLGATYGVGITGNAGPTSDPGEKPVGLVYISVAGPEGVTCIAANYRGTREDVRRRATQQALVMLRNTIYQDAAAS
jgi:nicotinamide-nucleotide amidase